MSGPQQQVTKNQSGQAINEASKDAALASPTELHTSDEQQNVREAVAKAVLAQSRINLPTSTTSNSGTLLDTPIPHNSATPEARFSSLSPKQQGEILAALTGDAAFDLQNRAHTHALSEKFGELEASLIISSGLLQEQTEQILKMPTERETRLSGFRTVPSSDALSKLNSIQIRGDSALSKIKDAALAELVASLSSEDTAKLNPAFSEQIFTRLSKSPDLMLAIQQSRYEESHINSERNIVSGAYREASSLREDLRQANLPSTLSSSTKGLEQTTQGFFERANSVSDTLEKNSSPLSRSRAIAHVATLLSSLPPSLELADNIILANRAAQLYSQSSKELFSASPTQPDLKAGLEHIRAGGESFHKSAKNLDITVNTMRAVRDGSVIVVAGGVSMLASPLVFGAVVTATGSSALGATVSVVSGAGVGTAVGGVYGGINSSLENGIHVLVGNKSAKDAQADTLTQLHKDAELGFIVGVGSGVSATVAKSLSSLNGTIGNIVKGAASGGAAAGASSVSRELLELTAAIKTFNSKHHGKTTLGNLLSPELAQHLKDSGFGFDSFKSRFGSDVAFGILLGGLGAQLQSIREAKTAAGAGISSQLAIDLADISSASAVGFARTYFSLQEDQRTFEELLPQSVGEAFSNFNSTIQGRVSVGRRVSISSADQDLLTRTSESLREDRLRDVYSGNGIQIHKSGKIVYVDDPQVLKELFAKVTNDQSFAQSVAAFYDPEAGVIVARRAGGGDRLSNVIKASFIRHEVIHRKGGSEEAAYRSQWEYLRKNGLQLSFVSGSPVIIKSDGNAAAPEQFEDTLQAFLNNQYSNRHSPISAVLDTTVVDSFDSAVDAYIRASGDGGISREKLALDALDLVESLQVKPSTFDALASLSGKSREHLEARIVQQEKSAHRTQAVLAEMFAKDLAPETIQAIISKTREMASDRNLKGQFLEFVLGAIDQVVDDPRISISSREKVLVDIIRETELYDQKSWVKTASRILGEAQKQEPVGPPGETLNLKLPDEFIQQTEAYWSLSNITQDQAKSLRIWLNSLIQKQYARNALVDLQPNARAELIKTITDIAKDPGHDGKLNRFIKDGWPGKSSIRELIRDPQSLKQQIIYTDITWPRIEGFIPPPIRDLIANSEGRNHTPHSIERMDGDGFIAKNGYRHKIRRYANIQVSTDASDSSHPATIQIRWHTKTPNQEVDTEHPSIVVELLDGHNQPTHRLVYSGNTNNGYWMPIADYSKMKSISFKDHEGRKILGEADKKDRVELRRVAEETMKNSHFETPL
jgi:hypothetical protein